MKSKARFLPFVLALALLTSLFVLSPATAATGSVTLSKSFITTPGGQLGITVSDADLNYGTVVQNESEGQDPRGAGGTMTYTIPARDYTTDSVLRFRTQRAPIESASQAELYPSDASADSTDRSIRVDYRDVILRFANATTTPSVTAAWSALTSPSGVDGDRHPFSLENAQGGAFILRTDSAVSLDHPIEFTVTYKAPDVQTTAVNLSSTQDIEGVSLTLTETGADTGVFTGSFTTGSSTSASPASISVIAGSLITVTYDDGGTRRVANATVETTSPTVTVSSPDHNHATRIRSQRLIAEVTDADSGIDSGSITFHVSATNLAGGSVAGPGVSVTEVTTVDIAGGYKAEVQLANVPAGETEVSWYVSVMDEAGNSATSDRDPGSDARDDYVIRVDTVAPALGTIQIDHDGDGAVTKTVDGAITGNSLNADGAAVTNAADGDPTSIRVVFNEALDSNSLQASDFRVDGVAPSDVSWSGSHPESAFLTVPTMNAADRPLIEVTGDISDTAGNVRPGGLKVDNALDGIGPSLTVDIDPTYATGDVTIRVRSDEPLLTVPSISINSSSDGLSVLRLVAADHYSATYSASDAPNIYNVQVSAQDTSANADSVGTGAHSDDGSITFEVDASLPAPTSITLPGHGAIMSADISGTYGITTQNPFITIEWDSEASEYVGDSHGAVDVTGLMIGDHAVNTPMGDEMGARTESGDVVFNVTKPSSNRLLISARGLAIGAYTISFNGADELGNALGDNVSISIEVKEPDPFSISLTPGWNLVSLPAEPQMSGVNDVVPADHPISIVLTYDPTQPGAWLSASRPSAGEPLSGSLESISARTAYWVFTDAFDSLSVEVMQQRGGAPVNLPTVNLVAGWNLLPVLDVSGGSAFGQDATSIGDYVSGVVRTYSYNASNDRFNQHSGMLQIGHGYWVYLISATVLVP